MGFSVDFRTSARVFSTHFERRNRVDALFSAFSPPFLRSCVKPRMAPSRIVPLAFLLTFLAPFFGAFSFVAVTRAADAAAGPLDQHTLDKRIGSVFKDLKLGDAALEAKVRVV